MVFHGHDLKTMVSKPWFSMEDHGLPWFFSGRLGAELILYVNFSFAQHN